MSWKGSFVKQLGKLNPRLIGLRGKELKAIPGINRRIEKVYGEMITELETSIKPYRDTFASFTRIPDVGRDWAEILHDMEAMRAHEEAVWKDGFVSGAVYHGDEDHIDFLNQVYAMNSQSNPLHADV